MVLRMKILNILGIHEKSGLYGGCSQKNNIEGEMVSKGRLGHYVDLRGGLLKKEWSGDYEGGG